MKIPEALETLPLKQYRLFLFDLDDTLINTAEAVQYGWHEALSEVCQQYPIDLPEAKNLLQSVVKEFGTTSCGEYWHAFAVLLTQEYGYPHPVGDQLNQIYTESYWRQLKVFDGVELLLESVQKQNGEMGLVTNGFQYFQYQKWKHVGLDQYVNKEKIICSSDVEFHQRKPSPYMIFQLLQQSKISPDEVIYFGDKPVDMIAGNLAGVTTVLIDEVPLDYYVDTPLKKPHYQ